MAFLLIAIVVFLALTGSRLFVIIGAIITFCFSVWVPDGWHFSSLVRIITKMESLTTKNIFLAIPFFIAAGTLMTKGGIAGRLIRVAKGLNGWLPGGLAITTVVACAIFGSISASSPVTLIAIGTIMYPALRKAGYPDNFALGLVSTAGSLGVLVPPSLTMLIYAISVSGTASVDPSELFISAIVPSIVAVSLLSIYCIFQGFKVPNAREPFDVKEVWESVREGFWALILPVIVLGGIYTGHFTPTEAGAVSLVYAVIAAALIYKDITLREVIPILTESGVLIGSLILIVVLAFGLNDFLAEVHADQKLVVWIDSMDLNTFQFLLFTNAVLICIGALMDAISATLIFAPILAPIACGVYGLDPLHFALVFCVNMELAYLVPPVATNLFVTATVFRKPFGQVAKAVFPTVGIMTIALLLFMYVPTLPLVIRNYQKGMALYSPFPWNGKEAVAAAKLADPGELKTPVGGGNLLLKSLKKLKQQEQEAAQATGE